MQKLMLKLKLSSNNNLADVCTHKCIFQVLLNYKYERKSKIIGTFASINCYVCNRCLSLISPVFFLLLLCKYGHSTTSSGLIAKREILVSKGE